MSLLDYFRRRNRSRKDETPAEFLLGRRKKQVHGEKMPPENRTPPRIRMPETRAAKPTTDPIEIYQRDAFAWSATACDLAAIVADVIMPDATQQERDDYAHDLAYEIMRAKYDEAVSTRAPAP